MIRFGVGAVVRTRGPEEDGDVRVANVLVDPMAQNVSRSLTERGGVERLSVVSRNNGVVGGAPGETASAQPMFPP